MSTGSKAEAGEWPEAKTRELRALWESGLRDHEIADRLGTTPRAVACKRHRIGLRKYTRDTSGRHTRAGAALASRRDLVEVIGVIYSMARSGSDSHEIADVCREFLNQI